MISPDIAAIGGATCGVGVVLAIRAIVPHKWSLSELANPNFDKWEASEAGAIKDVARGQFHTIMFNYLERSPEKAASFKADTDLLGIDQGDFFAKMLTNVIMAVVVAIILGGLLVNYKVPIIAIPILAAGGGLLMVADAFKKLRKDAEIEREAFHRSLTLFLLLVSQAMRASEGAASAFTRVGRAVPARHFQMINSAVVNGQINQVQLWDVIEEMAERYKLEDLPDLALTMRLAVTQNARVGLTLLDKAVSMRNGDLLEAERRATLRADKLSSNVLITATSFIVFIMFPVVYTMTHSITVF
ncbi:hypothetical protein [Ferrimicrobium acidiphilum]|uniref:hypothetical protein n=1 Tax=Ferrimicrobium acidiphilum TaxID=121039 RepID=UPI0023F245E8|nr:hypothetical protein [Ferrimicrobium acidiphilum]